jgi:hypothetical protein
MSMIVMGYDKDIQDIESQVIYIFYFIFIGFGAISGLSNKNFIILLSTKIRYKAHATL